MHNFLNNWEIHPSHRRVSNCCHLTSTRPPACSPWVATVTPSHMPSTISFESAVKDLWYIIHLSINFLFPWMLMSLISQDKYVWVIQKLSKNDWIPHRVSSHLGWIMLIHRSHNTNVTLTAIERSHSSGKMQAASSENGLGKHHCCYAWSSSYSSRIKRKKKTACANM